jgi:glycosyltransferase involved in cell wall biosynthesis
MKLALLSPRASGMARRFPSGGDLYDAQLALALERRGHTVDLLRTPAELDDRVWSKRLCSSGYAVILQDELGHAEYVRLNRRLAGRARTIAIVHVTRARLEPAAKSAALERAFVHSVESAVFVSRQVRRETERLLDVRVASQIAHPGCDHFPSLTPLKLRAAKVLQRTAASAVRFVCAGHLLPNKGQLELVEALANVRGPFTLALAGDPGRDRRYAARVRCAAGTLGAANVRLLGPQTAAQLARLFQRSDVFVSASAYESYGIAAAEALSAGLPVVSWAAGGLWEFLSPGENALRVAARDTAALTRALSQLCEDRGLLRRLQRGARRAGRSLPRWEDAAMRIERITNGLRHAAA